MTVETANEAAVVAGMSAQKIDYRSKMIDLYNSPEYQDLSAYYARKSAFSVLGIARHEVRHSNMIAWLLSPKGGHGFGKNPLRRFLQLLAVAKKRYAVNRDSDFLDGLLDLFITGNFDIADVEVEKEVPVANEWRNSDKDGRIDLVLKVGLVCGDEWKTLPVIIENKVDSDEHKVCRFNEYQTVVYRDWGETDVCRPRGFPLSIVRVPDARRLVSAGERGWGDQALSMCQVSPNKLSGTGGLCHCAVSQGGCGR